MFVTQLSGGQAMLETVKQPSICSTWVFIPNTMTLGFVFFTMIKVIYIIILLLQFVTFLYRLEAGLGINMLRICRLILSSDFQSEKYNPEIIVHSKSAVGLTSVP